MKNKKLINIEIRISFVKLRLFHPSQFEENSIVSDSCI